MNATYSLLGVGLILPFALIVWYGFRAVRVARARDDDPSLDMLNILADLAVVGAFMVDVWFTVRGGQ